MLLPFQRCIECCAVDPLNQSKLKENAFSFHSLSFTGPLECPTLCYSRNVLSSRQLSLITPRHLEIYHCGLCAYILSIDIGKFSSNVVCSQLSYACSDYSFFPQLRLFRRAFYLYSWKLYLVPTMSRFGKRKLYVVIAVFFSPFLSSTCAHDVLERFLRSICLSYQSFESSSLLRGLVGGKSHFFGPIHLFLNSMLFTSRCFGTCKNVCVCVCVCAWRSRAFCLRPGDNYGCGKKSAPPMHAMNMRNRHRVRNELTDFKK